MSIAIITGASSGVGEEFVKQVSARGSIDEFWLLGRDDKRLAQIAETIDQPTRLFAFDLTDVAARKEFLETVKKEAPSVRLLVNSAGFGVIGPFTEVSLKDNIGMVELNCTAVVELCYGIIPYMRPGGAIVNMASVAAFLPQTYFSVYAASKAFVLRFSQALAEELLSRDIRVVAVCPNPMPTRFFDRAGNGHGGGFKRIGFEPTESVVAHALYQLDRRRRVSVTHPAAKGLLLLSRILPHRVVTTFERLFF